MSRAKIIEVKLYGRLEADDGEDLYTVVYTYKGSKYQGRALGRDELDAWRSFQERLDRESDKSVIGNREGAKGWI